MRIGRLCGVLLTAIPLVFASSCGESSGGVTEPDPTVTGTPNQEGVRLLLVGGDQQVGTAGRALAGPVVVRVVDVGDRPVPNSTVNFLVLTGGGGVSPAQASTDGDGRAQAQWSLGATVGEQTLRVSGAGGTLTLSATATAPPVPVAQVRIQPDSLVLATGGTGNLSAIALDAQGSVLTGRVVAWSTSNAQVAALGSGGSVTGAAQGTAQVTATVEGVTASATVRVVPPPPVPVARVQVHPDSLVLAINGQGDLNAAAFDAQGNALTGRAVVWSSSDPGIVAVGTGGRVTGVAAGSARITATVEGITASASVRVLPAPPAPVARVRVQPDSLVLATGGRGDFSATAYDAQGNVLTGRAVAWSTSNAQVAALGAGGSVTGVAQGTAQVTATVEGVTASVPVRVVPPPPTPVARVRIQPDSLILATGGRGDFNAIALDAQGNVLTGRAVIWSTSNPGVAALGTGGAVTGIAQGTARVTATVEGIAATATVHVLPPPPTPVARVVIQPDSLVLAIGGRSDLNAVALDAQGNALTGRPVSWSSSDAAIASVGAGGAVTGVAAGSARVAATVEGITASATVRVLPLAPVPVARVRIQPDSLVLTVGSQGDFDAVAYDAQGNVVTGRPVTWTLSNPQGPFGPVVVASIGAGGVVAGVAPGTAHAVATVDGVTTSATVRVVPVPVSQVRVRPDSVVLDVGRTVDLSATALDAQGNTLTGRAITWASSNGSIAVVGSTGVVRGMGEGSARVTATVEGVTASATVRVRVPPPVPVASVRVEPDSLVLEAGTSGQLKAVARDAQGNVLTGRVVTWTTSNAGIASLGAGGTGDGVAEGTAQVTANVEGVTAHARVRVFTRPPAPAPVARVRIEPDSLVLKPGDKATFLATAFDAQGNMLMGRQQIWNTSDWRVVGMFTGSQITAMAEGTARVSVTIEGVSASATVRVVAPPPTPVARVRIQPDSLVLAVGGRGDFNAVAYDAGGNVLTGRAVAWASTNPGIANVGSGGAVYALSGGTARIAATVEGVTAQATVRVVPPAPVAVARVRVQPDSLVLAVGGKGDFNAAAYDAQGNVLTGRAITWSTSNAQVAALGAGGSVTAGAAGTAQVTATVEGVSGSAMVRVAQAPLVVEKVSGDGQSEVVGSRLPSPLAIRVTRGGQPASGVEVLWSTSTPHGSFTPYRAFTDANGRTQSYWGLGSVQGRQVATATVAGGGTVQFEATATAPPPDTTRVASIKIGAGFTSLEVGEKSQMSATALNSASLPVRSAVLTWSVSDPSIISVRIEPEGQSWGYAYYTALKPGEAYITVRVGEVNNTLRIRVYPVGGRPTGGSGGSAVARPPESP